MPGRTLLLTVLTLVAFAANSVLCRLALVDGAIDAASFTSVRIGSGALVLLLIIVLPRRVARRSKPPGATFGSWTMAVFLFAYAIAFSFAYLGLTAGTGGLILFGCVQATMILYGLAKGERPSRWEWVGLLVAVAGLVYLFLPKLEAPAPLAGSLMALAGVSWGFYSALGRGVSDPAMATTGNFVRAVPFAIIAAAVGFSHAHVSEYGLLLVVASGGVTSGIGYVLWYSALRGLSSTQAAVVQLAVPVIVALGGVAFIGEELTSALIVAGAMILGGIAIVVVGRSRARA